MLMFTVSELQHSDNDDNVRKHIIKKRNSLHSMLLLIPYNDRGTTTDPLSLPKVNKAMTGP